MAIGKDTESVAGGMMRLAELCEQLSSTSRKLEKRRLIAAYLRSVDAANAALAATYLAGQPFPLTDGRQLNVGGSMLSGLVAEISGAGNPGLRSAYLRHGDLGGAAADLLAAEERTPTLALKDVEAAFTETATESKPAPKRRILLSLLTRATPLEAKYLIKIMLGDLRMGVQESLVEEAVAEAYEAPVGEVRRAGMLSGNLREVVSLAAERRLSHATMKLFHPLGFMLASPVETVAEALERFSQEISSEKGSPGPEKPDHTNMTETVTEAFLEDKYDGIRAQIHCGDPEQPGRVALFSRSRDNMTESFPELVEAFAGFSEPVILDGEVLAWDAAWDPASDSTEFRGRALPFTALQPRIGRKRVTAEMRERAPVVFMAFDLLYQGGMLMLERPLVERRAALETLLHNEQARTVAGGNAPFHPTAIQPTLQFETPAAESPNAFPRLLLAPAVKLRSIEHLEQAYIDARARGNEGVMLKARHSLYQPGRRGLAWLKLKRELATLDVVVTAAEYGHGKRAGLLSDYTFAVRDGDTLKNVGKAYSGVTDAEIAMLTEFFLQHTLEDFGFIRSVEPRIVLEVAFNNVMRSDRHAGGFALRFPRIVRIRQDKSVTEIDTLERVAEIYRSDLPSGLPPGHLNATAK